MTRIDGFDAGGAEQLVRQGRDRSSAISAWLHQMELAMLVQPAPQAPGDQSRGDTSARSGPVQAGGAGSADSTAPWLTDRQTSDRSSSAAPDWCESTRPSAAQRAPDAQSRSEASLVARDVDLDASDASEALSPAASVADQQGTPSPQELSASASSASAQSPSAGATAVVLPLKARGLGVVNTVGQAGNATGQRMPSTASNSDESMMEASSRTTGTTATTPNRVDPSVQQAPAAVQQRSWVSALGARVVPMHAPARSAVDGAPASAPTEPPRGNPGEAPGKRHVHVARDGENVHVTIRDSALGSSAHALVVSRLVAEFHTAGLRLRAATINGSLAYQSQESDGAAADHFGALSPPRMRAANPFIDSHREGQSHGK